MMPHGALGAGSKADTPLFDADAAGDGADAARVFAAAAELFGVLATPLRLRIINAICNDEKGVNEIVEAVESTQPNVSQHLKVLYLAGIVAKRRNGNQIYYRVKSEQALQLCRSVCTQIAIEMGDGDAS